MNDQYPSNLFAAVAKNILDKAKGVKPAATIQKEAQDRFAQHAMAAQLARFEKAAADTVDPVAVASFLQAHNLAPEDFDGDRAALRGVQRQQQPAINQARHYFREQARMMGGMNDDLKHRQQQYFGGLEQAAHQVARNDSMKRTYEAAQQDPARFNHLLQTSQQAQQAFAHNPTTEILAPLSAIAGGIGGSLLGASPLQRALRGLGGAAAGGLAGAIGGRAAEEHMTGYAHRDIMPPYAVADRLQRQLETDKKVR